MRNGHGALVQELVQMAAPEPAGSAYLTLSRIVGHPGSLLDGYLRASEVMTGVGRDHGLILHAAAQTEEGC